MVILLLGYISQSALVIIIPCSIERAKDHGTCIMIHIYIYNYMDVENKFMDKVCWLMLPTAHVHQKSRVVP